MVLNSVTVKRAGNGCRYVCMPTHIGWKCGRCLTGQLGPWPKMRQRCRICKSMVVEVTERIGEGFGATIRQVDTAQYPVKRRQYVGDRSK